MLIHPLFIYVRVIEIEASLKQWRSRLKKKDGERHLRTAKEEFKHGNSREFETEAAKWDERQARTKTVQSLHTRAIDSSSDDEDDGRVDGSVTKAQVSVMHDDPIMNQSPPFHSFMNQSITTISFMNQSINHHHFTITADGIGIK